MRNEVDIDTPDLIQFVDIPCAVDERGALCFVENENLPFEIERVFWIYGVKEGMTRGNHAHTSCSEIIFPVCGSFDLDVDDGVRQACCHMDIPNKGVLIPANVWCSLKNFAKGTVCVVLASHKYDTEGYIHDYDTFKKMFG